jgi:protein involved in polysaccharide export with SLBB domain
MPKKAEVKPVDTKPKAKKPAAAKTVAVAATGPQKVFVARTGDVCEVDFKEGLTLGSAIEVAGFKLANVADVRVNAKKITDMKTMLKAGDQVTLLGKIAGA